MCMSFACTYVCVPCMSAVLSKSRRVWWIQNSSQLLVAMQVLAVNPSCSETAVALSHGANYINDRFLYACVPFSSIWYFKLKIFFSSVKYVVVRMKSMPSRLRYLSKFTFSYTCGCLTFGSLPLIPPKWLISTLNTLIFSHQNNCIILLLLATVYSLNQNILHTFPVSETGVRVICVWPCSYLVFQSTDECC